MIENTESSNYELIGRDASAYLLSADSGAAAAPTGSTATELLKLIDTCVHAKLRHRITAALSEAVSQVSADGRIGIMPQCVQCSVPPPATVSDTPRKGQCGKSSGSCLERCCKQALAESHGVDASAVGVLECACSACSLVLLAELV